MTNSDPTRISDDQHNNAPAVPLGYINAGHLHEMQSGRLPYAYLYAAPGVGVEIPVYTSNAPAVPTDSDPTSKEQYRRMFVAACEALGAISDALGCNPEDGGAEPILGAVEELQISLGLSNGILGCLSAAHAVPQGWAWMTHPSRNNGQPFPVRFFEDGDLYFQPFDFSATEFEWSHRDDGWDQVALPATPAPAPAQEVDEAQIQKLRENGAKAWAGVDAQQLRAGFAAPSQEPVACGLCQGSGVLSPTQKCICQYGGKEPAQEEVGLILSAEDVHAAFAKNFPKSRISQAWINFAADIAQAIAARAAKPAQEVQSDPNGWCEYVAGMVFGWLQMTKELPEEDRSVAAIAGIIRRRLWAYKPAHPEPVTLTDEEIEDVFEQHKGTAGKELRATIGRAIISALRAKGAV